MRPRGRDRLAAGTLAVLVVLTGLGAARGETPPQDEGVQDAERDEADERIERLTAWPELERGIRGRVSTELQRLRKAHTEEMGAEARAALVAAGPGVVPRLLPALGKEKDAAARARIDAVLVALTGAPHTRLLAAEFGARSAAVRAWCLRRVALFPDPGTRGAAQAAWNKVHARAEKGKADADEHLAAALALAASGVTDGLPHLHDRARKGWKKIGRAVRAAVEGVRGEKATALLLPLLDGDRAGKIAALRVLAGCGAEGKAIAAVRPFLDVEDAGLRIAAINALRGIVDGTSPLEKLSAFDAIEKAREWKRRI